MSIIETSNLTEQTEAADRFNTVWESSVSGDKSAQLQWQNLGGSWLWRPEGLVLDGQGSEWFGYQFAAAKLKPLRNVLIEVSVSGKAEAAGLSFGDFRDFLAPIDPGSGARRLQLEIDSLSNTWRFRVSGRHQSSAWWNSEVRSADDLLSGALQLKARNAEAVTFQDLKIKMFEASCQISIIITCYRFLQRLRVTLRNWCHQDSPSGAFEIVVVNPESPDATHDFLASAALEFPDVRLRELLVKRDIATDKGAMINRALRATQGEFIWLTDADCVFPANSVTDVMRYVEGNEQNLFYGQRLHLNAATTDALLEGRVDALAGFQALAHPWEDLLPINAPWGYTQVVHRSVLERIPYREGVNHFAGTDNVFVQDCQDQGIEVEQIPGLVCLHLDHPFAWNGTTDFL